MERILQRQKFCATGRGGRVLGDGLPGTEEARPCLAASLPAWPSFCRTNEVGHLCVRHRVNPHGAASGCARCGFWSQAAPALKPDAVLQISRISFLICKMGATVVTSLVGLY